MAGEEASSRARLCVFPSLNGALLRGDLGLPLPRRLCMLAGTDWSTANMAPYRPNTLRDGENRAGSLSATQCEIGSNKMLAAICVSFEACHRVINV